MMEIAIPGKTIFILKRSLISSDHNLIDDYNHHDDMGLLTMLE